MTGHDAPWSGLEPALPDWLRTEPGTARPLRLEPVSGGNSNETAPLITPEGRRILCRGFGCLRENPALGAAVDRSDLPRCRTGGAEPDDRLRKAAPGLRLATRRAAAHPVCPAELTTEVDVTRSYVREAVLALNDGTLSSADAAKAKWWTPEMHKRLVDRCVQLAGRPGPPAARACDRPEDAG
jgi:hypothetical protein